MILINQNSTPMTDDHESSVPAVQIPSLPEVYRTIEIPNGGVWWRRFFAFLGPGYLVSVGYMDPGNWATDIAGGSKFGYTLLSVILISNLMAILLQALCVRLGVATGRDLAQACRDYYSRPVDRVLGPVRDRDRRLRPGGAARQRAGAQPAVRHSDGDRRLPDDARCLCCCGCRTRVSVHGGDCRDAGGNDRVCFGVQVLMSSLTVWAWPVASSRPRRCWPIPRCSTSPWASSAPRSCRTTCICTRRSCRRARGTHRMRPSARRLSTPVSIRRSRCRWRSS